MREFRGVTFWLLVLASLSCGRKSSQPHDGGPGGTFECPTAPEDTAGKIRDEAFLQQQPDAEYPVAVWLKAEANTAPCVGSTDGGTRCSDEAIEDRVRANGSQVQCVVNWLRGDSGHGPSLVPIWYEAPDIESTGRPAPIGAAFTTTLSVPQIKSLADNAFVEAIEPAPGSAAGVAVTALVEPADCPASVDAPDAKLSDATTIQGQGRQAVVVDFRDDGVLPPEVGCSAGDPCDAMVNRLWERTILNTREVTCVRRWIDGQLLTPPDKVAYAEVNGSVTAPALPPFGQAAGVVKAVGMGLTWEEATAVARNPYVAKIWTSPGLAIDPGTPTCPGDLSSPIPTPTCTTETEPIDTKIDAHSMMVLEQATGPVGVLIRVKGGAMVCDVSAACSSKPVCPSLDAVHSRWAQENVVSQMCVRALVSQVGGTNAPESDVTWIVDAFLATMTWPQIQMVAASPAVLHVDPNVQ